MSAAITAWLDDAQAKVNAATEGPWEQAAWNGMVTLGAPFFDEDGEPDQPIVATAGNRYSDAAFIADARTRLPQAIAALRAVLDMAETADAHEGAERSLMHSSALRHAIYTALGVQP